MTRNYWLMIAFMCVVAVGCGRPRSNPIDVTEHETLVTDANFEAEVVDSTTPVLLDFSASWCPPCQEMAPIVAQIAEENEGKLKVGVVDTDQDSSMQTTQAFRVNGIPAFFLVVEGEPIASVTGYRSKKAFEKWINETLTDRLADEPN